MARVSLNTMRVPLIWSMTTQESSLLYSAGPISNYGKFFKWEYFLRIRIKRLRSAVWPKDPEALSMPYSITESGSTKGRTVLQRTIIMPSL